MILQLENKWVKLGQKGDGPGARSSHAMAVVGNKIYSFGGEFKPTIPVDNHLYVYDLKTQTWSIAPATGDIPMVSFGVGMVTIGNTIYLFGGRDEARNYNGLYAYDTVTNEWKLVSPSGEGLPGRSYHAMAADDQNVYVFGGVTAAGRVNTLHAFNVVDNKWVEFPSPGDSCEPRGAPGLAAVQGKIWVLFGFNGKHALDDIHCFDLAEGKWTSVATTGDVAPARSVFATVVTGKHIVVFGGELEPSPLMHMGAGRFCGQAYALDTETLEWRILDDASVGTEKEHPRLRGWCGFAGATKNGEEGLVIHGGNSPSNERFDDFFFFGFSSLANAN